MTLNFWISSLHLPCAKITGKCESQGLVYAMLETIKPRSSCMLGKHSTNYAASPPYRVISTSFLSLESKNRTRKEVLYSAPSILCLAVAIIAKMSSQTFSFPDSERRREWQSFHLINEILSHKVTCPRSHSYPAVKLEFKPTSTWRFAFLQKQGIATKFLEKKLH